MEITTELLIILALLCTVNAVLQNQSDDFIIA